MKGTGWVHLWVGGVLVGLLRGLLEVFRLLGSYPVVTNTWALASQLLIAYAVVIATAGAIVAWLIWRISRRNKAIRMYLPIAWLIALITIDSAGILTPVTPALRLTRSMPPQFEPPKPPADFLIVTIDTCRADYIGAYGNSIIKTPTIDRLSQRGVIIAEAIAPIPVTTSSHATIFTGQDPPEHGSRFNAVPVSASSRTQAEVFRDHGFRTGAFISAFPVVHEVSGLGRGFEIFDQLLTPSKLHPLIYRSTLLQGLTRFGPFRPAERKWFRVIQPVQKWWAKTRDDSRFTWVHFYDPHFPYRPGFPYSAMYLDEPAVYAQSVRAVVEANRSGNLPDHRKIVEFKGLYAGEVSAVDHAIEELIREISSQDRLEKTLIVITADHGESLDEHGYFFSHGDNLHDPSIKVPLLATYPGVLPQKRIVPGQMRLADLYAVTGQLMGVSAGMNADKAEIAKAWLGEIHEIPPSNAYCETGTGVYTAAHEPSMEKILKKDRALRTESRKVIWSPTIGMTGYDLDNDAVEMVPYRDISAGEFEPMCTALTNYIKTVDPPDRIIADLPGKEVKEQLEMLGYIERN